MKRTGIYKKNRWFITKDSVGYGDIPEKGYPCTMKEALFYGKFLTRRNKMNKVY